MNERQKEGDMNMVHNEEKECDTEKKQKKSKQGYEEEKICMAHNEEELGSTGEKVNGREER